LRGGLTLRHCDKEIALVKSGQVRWVEEVQVIKSGEPYNWFRTGEERSGQVVSAFSRWDRGGAGQIFL
jgi:hypothetical protein